MNKKDNLPKKRPISAFNPHLSKDYTASHLFEREPAKEYTDEWTETLMQQPPVEQVKDTLSVLVFRLGHEWLALPTIYVKEIQPRRPIHGIPHRQNKILLGIVNLNGELQLFIALHQFLEIEAFISSSLNQVSHQQERMIAIAKEGALWVFPVDEVEGIYQWDLTTLENVPVNVSKSSINYMKGMMKKDNKMVGLLDEELLFSSLKRSMQ